MLFSYFKDKWNRWRAEKERMRREAEETACRTVWRLYHESRTMDDVSRMSGVQFEEFLARLFSLMGYSEISLTPPNDQGGDLLCLSPSRVPIVIQAKRWKGTVGNDAVQELLGAMRHYGRGKGMVVTNSTFTQAAVKLAGSDGDVMLCDKQWLEEQISKFLPPIMPEFNREGFDRILMELCELTRGMASMRAGQTRRRGAREDYTFIGMLTRAAEAKGSELTREEIMEIARLHVRLAEAQENLIEAAKNWSAR